MQKAICLALALTLALSGLYSCGQDANKEGVKTETKEAPKPATEMKAHGSNKLDIKGIPNLEKSDPFCGMPVTAGIMDTVTSKGKVYGFCAKECKEEFLKAQTAAK